MPADGDIWSSATHCDYRPCCVKHKGEKKYFEGLYMVYSKKPSIENLGLP